MKTYHGWGFLLVSTCYISDVVVVFLKYVCYFCRKRAESDSRKSSIPNSKEVPSHHPTDPVELRRLNFQTPGKKHDVISTGHQ